VFLLRLGALGGLDYNFLFFQDPICHVGCTVLDINPPRSQKKKKWKAFTIIAGKQLSESVLSTAWISGFRRI
jgi:hypothetical protein